MDLIFATNNVHKIKEVSNLVNRKFHIIGLAESGFRDELPEDYGTLEENSRQKAWYIYKCLGISCFADDTGLEVEALNNAPGVYSARYSRMGNGKYAKMGVVEGNICKLLDTLKQVQERQAKFRTVISLILEGKEFQFEGMIKGFILEEKRGNHGFGYDPVFLPEGFSQSFAEMKMEEKNRISHRSQAIGRLVDFLNDL
jgi:XTP/dITP diphosphohydrolase